MHLKETYLHGEEKVEARRIISEKTGYIIKSTSILSQIFRRSSFAAEMGVTSNEIFEFIGDQVLDYYVVKIVSERCGSLGITDDYTFRIRENRFTFIKQTLVSNEALAKIIDEWEIVKYLRLGRSDIKNEVAKEQKVKADLFEAVIGAIAIESNWDTQVLETAVRSALDMENKITDLIESDTKVRCFNIDNAITTLKEFAEHGRCTMPSYKFAGPDYVGYYEDGKPKWFCTCCIVDEKIGITYTVESTSKSEAKKAAAYLVLCQHLGMQNQYGPNDWYSLWTYKDGKLTPNRKDNKKVLS